MSSRSQPSGMWARKPIEALVAETGEEDTKLRRAVGVVDLTALGLGAIIGTGIFVIIVIYFAYGRTHSRLARGEDPAA